MRHTIHIHLLAFIRKKTTKTR